MVVDDDEAIAAKAFTVNSPISPSVVPAATIMAQLHGHLNKKPAEISLPGTTLRVVSPIEPVDHTPLRRRDRRFAP